MVLLHKLAYALPRVFWPVWSLGLAVALGVALWLLRLRRVEGSLAEPAPNRARSAPRTALAHRLLGGKAPRLDVVVVRCFAVFLLGYLWFMFWGEDFAYHDNHHFTDAVIVGKLTAPPIWLDAGRFFPLAYQEYNLFSLWAAGAKACLLIGALQLLVGSVLLFAAMSTRSVALRLATLGVLMLAPAFASDFAELTYADRNVVFAIAVFVYAVKRYDARPVRSWLALAIATAYAALYYKEATVTFFFGFAAMRLLQKAKLSGARAALLGSSLELGLLASCAYFAALLGLTLFVSGTSRYVESNSVGRVAALLRYLTADPLVTVFVVCFAVHVVSTLRLGRKLDGLWDALAVGALLHFAAVCSTGIAEDYLLGPTELVGALTISRLASGWWRERPAARPLWALGLGLAAFMSVTFGSYRLIQRKNVVRETVKISDFLLAYVAEREGQPVQLYFPSLEDGQVMNFISFLNYRGLKLRRSTQIGSGAGVDVAGAATFVGDRCVPNSDYVCRHAAVAVGDLVVRLPEDELAQSSPSDSLHLDELFATRPFAFDSLGPVLSVLHAVSPTLNGDFHHDASIRGWLRGRVAKVVEQPAS